VTQGSTVPEVELTSTGPLDGDHTSYDDVPYLSHPFAGTHPDRLATTARVFGLTTAPPQRCRVLELGCASGANLLPMAMALPESQFVGIDLSQVQIAEGIERIERVGCTNLQLRRLSILDLDALEGTFDFILCHGVYSWVPVDVRERILEICHRRLSPTGVAYVSYNIDPGWRLPGVIRDLMLYHVQRFTEPASRIAQARAVLEFLAHETSKKSPYRALFEAEAERVRGMPDSYLFHEHLEAVNTPVYFHEFVAAASAHGLQYLGDVDVATMYPVDLSAEAREALKGMARTLIDVEQYLDFVRNRRFRRTLLCHAGVPLDHKLAPQRLFDLWLASSARPVPRADDSSPPERVEYKTLAGRSVPTSDPLMKSALQVLGDAWPAALHFRELAARVQALTEASDPGQSPPSSSPETLASEVARRMLICFLCGALQLHTDPPKVAARVSERPEASKVARMLPNADGTVTNLRHEAKTLSPLRRHLLSLLDGTRDRAALLDRLCQLVESGAFVIAERGEPISDPAGIRPALAQMLEPGLRDLLMHSLLVA
jgi:methyltransferase-like protein/2-polyprenyl-3-methyl-5-hydroxy-6-metoxy-1,4-benzoquinol methylase